MHFIWLRCCSPEQLRVEGSEPTTFRAEAQGLVINTTLFISFWTWMKEGESNETNNKIKGWCNNSRRSVVEANGQCDSRVKVHHSALRQHGVHAATIRHVNKQAAAFIPQSYLLSIYKHRGAGHVHTLQHNFPTSYSSKLNWIVVIFWA